MRESYERTESEEGAGGKISNCQSLETNCLKPMIQFRNLDIPSLVRILTLYGKNYAFWLLGMDQD